MVECTSTDLGGKDCILLFDMRNLGSRPIDEYLSPYRRISLTLCSDIKLENNFDLSLVIKIIFQTCILQTATILPQFS